ncbi:MAG: tripartite tricarboxylate transporter substrate binding protein [Eubacteriales bacterium]|nr:tripartite tricarboxylate transporter substrate binding protein [Eubacteriales bacterium]
MKKIIKVMTVLCAAAMLTACSGGSSSTATTTAAAAPAETKAAETQAAAETSAAAPAASAETSTWPDKNVTILLNQTAGGGSDMLTRLLADALGNVTGQNFVVENDTSGASMTAYETTRNGKPDGYSIFGTNCGMLTRIASGQYNHTLDEFTVLGLYTTPSKEGYGIYVKGDSQFETLDDLIKYDQEKPGELITSGQTGGFVMFMEAELETRLGIQPTFVEGGSDADRILTILGNSVDYCLLANLSARQYVESGDLKCLAMVNDKSDLMPDVPTLSESGYENINMSNLMLLLGPAGMSDADVQAISAALEKASKDTTLVEGYTKMNCVWDYQTPEESKKTLEDMYNIMVSVYPTVQAMGLG